jgi:hypothetical protein
MQKKLMISFEALALVFIFLWIFMMSIDFSYEVLGEYAILLKDFLNSIPNFLNLIPGLNTGFGIVLGNLIINWFKHINSIKDISKVFGLILENQMDDLYNIRISCEEIKKSLISHERITPIQK